MKKLYTLFTIAGIVTSASVVNAQVQLTSAQLPVAGNAYIQASLIVPSNFTFSTTGAGLSWDFSAMTPSGGEDTTFFVAPSSTPTNAYTAFPTANIAILEGAIGEIQFIKGTSTDVQGVGFFSDPLKTNNPIPIAVTPALTVFTFPFTYQTAISNNCYAQIKVKGSEIGQPTFDSVRIKHSIIQNSLVTGYGNLITPTGTYPNSLIQRNLETTIDSQFVKGTITGGIWILAGAPDVEMDSVYKFYDGTSVASNIEIEYNDNGLIGSITYLKSKDNMTVGVSKTATVNNILAVFPTPFNGTTCFAFAAQAKNVGGYTLNIYDAAGSLVDVRTSITGDRFVYNSKLSAGMYFYQLLDGSAAAGKGKLVVE